MTKNTRTNQKATKNSKGRKDKEEKSKMPSKKVTKKPSKTQGSCKRQNKKSNNGKSQMSNKTTCSVETTVTKQEKSVLNTINGSTKNNTNKKGKEKWPGEEAAKTWVKGLESLNLNAEYEEIKKMTVQGERCKVWQANMAKNRHNDYKCYDDNRVVVQMGKSDYINASKINIPNFTRPAFLVQLPKLENKDEVEDFWRMIFNEQCSAVHLLAQSKELEGGSYDKLFAQENGGYFYANTFFVNTRKVDKNPDEKMDIHTVELLPEGCSNSVICQVYTHYYWKAQGGPEKFYAPIRAATAIAKVDLDKNPVAIVSLRGAGRNASLLTMAVVVSHFLKGTSPNIKDIVRSVREQRPMAVDSRTQYTSIYLAACWLVKAKINNNEEIKQRLKKFRDKFETGASQISQVTKE